jgi:hypothetical protein
MENQIPSPENESDINVKPARLKAIRNLLANLFLPNRFWVAFRTEVELQEARQRIEILLKRNKNLLKTGRSATAKWGGYELLLAVCAKKFGRNRLVIPQSAVDSVKNEFRLNVTKHGEAFIIKLKEK